MVSSSFSFIKNRRTVYKKVSRTPQYCRVRHNRRRGPPAKKEENKAKNLWSSSRPSTRCPKPILESFVKSFTDYRRLSGLSS